ncbi:pilus assembly PilX family protein [Microbulbifer marinus]|uniref:PilX N-terminal n=1 Tax=Microbulbifer marinus TaxID=658218 RepID=A0A1H4BI83_9GAMM|nr:PilX N-terminal domain-containing pilus assembly protein [Microbulbifer marinus]SEA47873.1 PilX N-terminal [Microbulbifer marinus]
MQGYARQKGAVLVISLIILLVLTMIGVSAARTVLLEEKMTFASRDAKVALEVAEALVKQGEHYIDSLSTTGDFGVSAWLHTEGGGPNNLLDAATWGDANSLALSKGEKLPNVPNVVPMNGNGRIYIEMTGNADKEDPADSITVEGYGQTTGGGEIQVFRIVAQGQGINDATTRTIISHYGKRF